MAAYRLTVSGKVQGVSFRQFTVDSALSFGITGWVKNDPQGTVSVLAQGSEQNLNQFIALLSKGPDFAQVEDVKKIHLIENGSIKDFTVKY